MYVDATGISGLAPNKVAIRSRPQLRTSTSSINPNARSNVFSFFVITSEIAGKRMVNLSSFWKEAPTHIRVYPCPTCNETISADASDCRFCHLSIDANTAQRLLTESQRVTTAVAQANTFSISTSGALLLTGFAFFNLYVDRSLTESLVVSSFIAFA